MEEHVSSIITGVLRQDRKPKSNYMSLSMTEGLMRVAGTRIFTVPEQSFMELVTNSIDSYDSDTKIGKFGMGFYSIFYWLYNVPNSNIVIDTTYEVEEGKRESYKATIRQTDKGPYIRIDPIDSDEGCGTIITVNTRYDLKEAKKQVDNLRLNTMAKITVNNLGETYVQGSGKFSVGVAINRRAFTVSDGGPGIPFHILIDTMMVPSISSKKRPKSLPYILKKPDINMRRMHITVGGIIIYSSSVRSSGFVLDFPSTTPVPVSRDDIILVKEVADFMYAQLVMIANKFIRSGTVVDLFNHLNEYATYSPQVMASYVVSRVKSYVSNKEGIITVKKSSDFYHFLVSLSKSVKDFPLVVISDYMSIYKIETLMEPYLASMAMEEKKFHLKEVIHQEGVKTMFLSKYIITDISVKDWDTKLMVGNSTTLLYPYGYTNTSINPKVEDFFKGEDKDYVYTAINIWDTISQTSKPKGVKYSIINLLHLIKEVFPMGDTFKDFTVNMIGVLSKVKYNFTYGASKSILYDTNGPFNYTSEARSLKVYPEHTKECIFWYLQTIPTINTGSFSWFPNSEPCFLLWDIYEDYHDYGYDDEYYNTRYLFMMNGLSKCLNPAEKIIFNNLSFYVVDYKVEGLSDMIIGEIQRFGGKEIESLLISEMGKYMNYQNIESTIINPIIESINLYTRKFKGELTYPPKSKWNVTASQLTSYLYSTDRDIKDMDTIEVMERASASTYPINKLKTVSIAVNEGTTKGYGTSVITELVQNSIDASRTSGLDDPIRVVMNSDGFTVLDGVGINKKDLAYILIPFVSSKDANDINVTGEMGTGFFNVYRECYAVIIVTAKDGIMTRIIGTPIKDSDGRVVDINYNFISSPSDMKQGTSITVHLSSDKIKKTQALIDVSIYLQKYLAYVPRNITVNGTPVQGKKSLVLSEKYADVYITDDKTIPSFVMTNDVPFADFGTFMGNYPVASVLLKLTKLRVIINIKKEVYLPSQSRTKISVKGNQKEFVYFLNDALHAAIVYLYCMAGFDHPDLIIPFSSSVASIYNLKLDDAFRRTSRTIMDTDGVNVVRYYSNGLLGNTNIVKVINSAIKLIEEGGEEEKSLTEPYKSMVKVWMYGKSKMQVKIEDIKVVGTTKDATFVDVDGVDEGKDGGDKGPNDAIIMSNLQVMVNAYWSILYKCQGTSMFNGKIGIKPPLILSSHIEANVSGYYNTKNHYIVLNNATFDSVDIETVISNACQLYHEDTVKAVSYIRSDPTMIKLVAPVTPSTTLLHELLHAVMGKSHTDSDHDTPPFTVNCKEGTFDEIAVELYKLVCQMGLYDFLGTNLT